jgi:hypothetical protein
MKAAVQESVQFAGDVVRRLSGIWKVYVLAVLGVVGGLIVVLCVVQLAEVIIGAGASGFGGTSSVLPEVIGVLALLAAVRILWLLRKQRMLRRLLEELQNFRHRSDL